ncbi:unnamed protein product [Ranitomeya imitator]|uniref:Uncharacterized protein n=1 Tax=Ranitomeya imitator TaxID=111125 RepID=A0ABN9LBM8_9NEOB|nr:unnamed protein product [Ranitomeya imitator]
MIPDLFLQIKPVLKLFCLIHKLGICLTIITELKRLVLSRRICLVSPGTLITASAMDVHFFCVL